MASKPHTMQVWCSLLLRPGTKTQRKIQLPVATGRVFAAIGIGTTQQPRSNLVSPLPPYPCAPHKPARLTQQCHMQGQAPLHKCEKPAGTLCIVTAQHMGKQPAHPWPQPATASCTTEFKQHQQDCRCDTLRVHISLDLHHTWTPSSVPVNKHNQKRLSTQAWSPPSIAPWCHQPNPSTKP